MSKKQLLKRAKKKYSLTPRELEVCGKIISGDSCKVIAIELDIHLQTVKFHLRNIYRKTKSGAMARAIIILLGSKLTN
jgi:DNA-binding CsgD family transcriptional regulator